MRPDEIELKPVAVLLADGNVGKGSEACGDSVDDFIGIGHHIINSLPAFSDHLPGGFSEVNLLLVVDNLVELLES